MLLQNGFTTIVFIKKDIAGFKFDETFSEYSYLEDLDLAKFKEKNKKIFISSKAKFKHPENIDEVVSILEKLKF